LVGVRRTIKDYRYKERPQKCYGSVKMIRFSYSNKDTKDEEKKEKGHFGEAGLEAPNKPATMLGTYRAATRRKFR
jgi:hypothetical protein